MTTTKQKLNSIGKRKAYTIYVDKKVWRQFKPLVQDMSKGIQSLMTREIAKHKLKMDSIYEDENY